MPMSNALKTGLVALALVVTEADKKFAEYSDADKLSHCLANVHRMKNDVPVSDAEAHVLAAVVLSVWKYLHSHFEE